MTRGPAPVPALQRFHGKYVVLTTGCWEWQAARNAFGYGTFNPRPGMKVYAHRWFYEQVNGVVPPGLQLDHLCRVRECVNPAHLEPVTPHVNQAEGQHLYGSRRPLGDVPERAPVDAREHLHPTRRAGAHVPHVPAPSLHPSQHRPRRGMPRRREPRRSHHRARHVGGRPHREDRNSSMSSLADALAGGSRFIKWDDLTLGSSVTGTITKVDMRQARKYQSTDLDFWDDGKPKMQAVLSLDTALRDPADPDDDGERSIGINLWSGQKKALVDACKAIGVAEPQPGQTFTATWVSGVGKSGDPRVFAFKLGPATGGLGNALGTVDTTTGEITPPTPTAAPAPGAAVDPAAVAAALQNLTPEQKAALGIPA